MDMEEFEAAGNGEERLSTSEAVVKFLLENRDRAWQRREIADEINRDPNTVGTNLSRLKDRGLVRHRKNHWAITDDHHRLVEATQFSKVFSTLNESVGSIIESEEEAKAWSDAQPDRPHPSLGDGEGDNDDDQ
jgi:DNA-binding transcriptional regulator YhcF (GntR family)